MPIVKGSFKYNTTEDFTRSSRAAMPSNTQGFSSWARNLWIRAVSRSRTSQYLPSTQSIPIEYTVYTNRVHSPYLPRTQSVPTEYIECTYRVHSMHASKYLGVPQHQQYIGLIKYLGSSDD